MKIIFRVSIVDNRTICSVRSTAVTIIIVIFIISAAAVAVGVTISKSSSDQGTSGTQTGNNNQNSVSTLSTTIVTSSVSIGSQTGLPCSSYTTINDPTRNANVSGLYSTCDTGPLFNTTNGGSWIRFIGTGGTIIPMTSPGPNHCGGYLPGWSNGSLPTTVGLVANTTICFELNGNPCQYLALTPLVNCGGFYVYFLRPVRFCSGRYCTI